MSRPKREGGLFEDWDSVIIVEKPAQELGALVHGARLIGSTPPLSCTATSEVHAFSPRCSQRLQVSSWQGRKAPTPQPRPVTSPSRLPPSSPYLVNEMAIDFNKLWKEVRTATDKAKSVRTLAKILSSKDGRTFILDLEPSEAKACIEILDHVRSLNP